MKILKYAILPNVNVLQSLKLSFLAFLVILLTGCWSSKLVQEETSKLVMINVLDPDYYADCHITGSINIPFDQFESRMKTFDKKNQYVLYCSNYACTAAPFAAKMLKDAGFEKVSFFPGGIVQWHQEGHPRTGPAQKSYLNDANEKFEDEDHMGVDAISAQDLQEAMRKQGLI